MKVKDLIEMLAEFPANAEVRIAYQPNYPLQCSIGAVTDLTGDLDDRYDEDDVEDVEEADKVVWLATGSPTSSGYAPRAAWLGEDLQ